MSQDEQPTAFTFEGFEPANTTPVPDVLFDELLTELSGTELKVVLYIIRRTLGFKKVEDGISLSQFTDGITTREGKILDKGCGIKKRSTVSKTLRDLIGRGYVEAIKKKTNDGDSAVTVYRVRFKGVVPKSALPSAKKSTTLVPKSPLPGSAQTATTGSADLATHNKQLTTNSNVQETEEQEENAHVSDDNAPTPSLSESNSPSSLFSQYDLLLAYRDNQLEHLYECEKAAMVNMSQKLSPNRAGELAAAKLSVQFCEQYVRFKDEVDNLARTPSQQVTPEQEALYDWLVDHWNVRSDLTTLSGTRTLILDEDMYRSSLQETSIEESTSAPSDEQTSEVSDSQSKDVPPAQETGKTSSGKGSKDSKPGNTTAKKPTPGAEEKALRRQVQKWIDEKRGYKLYGSATEKQIFAEQNAVSMFALKLLNEQQGNHEDGCTWEELDHLWKETRKDTYWGKPENIGRIGGYALQQQFTTIILGKYRKTKLKQMRDQNAAQGATQTGTNMSSAVQEHRQMSDLERRNAELRAKYGQKQIS